MLGFTTLRGGEQAATKKVAALARHSNPDDLVSELFPDRSPQRANAATVMQVLSESAARGHGSLRWNLMTHEVEVEGMALSPRRTIASTCSVRAAGMTSPKEKPSMPWTLPRRVMRITRCRTGC